MRTLFLAAYPVLALGGALLARGADAPAAPESDAPEPVPVTEVLRPFNGRDFDGFYLHQQDATPEEAARVWRAADGVIHCSGEGAGYLATRRAYRDYQFSVEYRWGEKTDGSGFVRNSGILVHKINPDRVWPTCLEIQLAQGCEGDFIVIPGQDAQGKPAPATLTSDVRIASDGKTRWQLGGEPTVYRGRQFWWSEHQPGFEEQLDTRGEKDVASPLGEWTRVDVLCRGDRVTVRINGVTVNECYDVFPAAGRILLQNEGNEVYFRNLELRPLP